MTAYEMRISDWSSDVCSSDLRPAVHLRSRVTVSESNRGCGRSAVGYVWREIVAEALRAARGGVRQARRSEERSGGKEGSSTCRSRWWPEVSIQMNDGSILKQR